MGKSRKEIEEIVSRIAGAIAGDLGIELVDVEYVKEGRDYWLRVFIDKPGGVTLNDCEAVSVPLSDALDEADPIPGPYSLEVSSPGVERPLKRIEDYIRFAGRTVRLRTFGPIDGRRNWKGELIGVEEDRVKIVVDGATFLIPFESIARANLVAEF